jgi:hypothetical protein
LLADRGLYPSIIARDRAGAAEIKAVDRRFRVITQQLDTIDPNVDVWLADAGYELTPVRTTQADMFGELGMFVGDSHWREDERPMLETGRRLGVSFVITNDIAAAPRLARRIDAVTARIDRFLPVALAAIGLAVGLAFALSPYRPPDADTVWRMGQSGHYGVTWAVDVNSRYVYPPVLAQLVGVFSPFGWPAFIVVWEGVLFVGLWIALRRWSVPVLAIALVSSIVWGFEAPLSDPLITLLIGNIQILVAASIVVGFRHPAAWAFVLLTKIGPGVGLLWFVARREWRQLGIALGTTAAIAAVCVAIAPGLWADFVRFALNNAGTPSPVALFPVPLLVRLPIACVAIWWAARTDRPWVVPLAAGMASLALYQWTWVTMAAASLALAPMPNVLRRGAAPERQADDPPPTAQTLAP